MAATAMPRKEVTQAKPAQGTAEKPVAVETSKVEDWNLELFMS